MASLNINSRSGGSSNQVSRKKGFADLDLSLHLNKVTKDISILKDDAAIKNAVKNLLRSNFYERPFQHTLGANLRGLLFEPNDVLTRVQLREGIQQVLSDHEPRISSPVIDIQEASQGNAFKITDSFQIISSLAEEKVELIRRRLR